MNIQLTGLHNLTLTPALKEHVNEKFKRLKKHFEHIMNAHVTLSVDKKFQQIAKAHMHLAGHGDINASCTAENMYASIDLLVDKLDEQIKKHKEKLKNKHSSAANEE